MNLIITNENNNLVFNESCFECIEIEPSRFALVNHEVGLALTSFGNKEAVFKYPKSFLANKKALKAAVERYEKHFGVNDL